MSAKHLVQDVRRDLIATAFRGFFGIGEMRARMLVSLYAAGGAPVTINEFQRDVDSHRRPTHAAIWESIRILRACMEAEAIDKSEAGYFLTEVGMAECSHALRDAASAVMGIAAREALSRPLADAE